jgi:hypothetical protein
MTVPTKNPFQAELRGTGDAFVTKFDVDGKRLIYSTYLGGTDDDFPGGIAVDDAEHAYVAGFTVSFDFPTKNSFHGSHPSSLQAAFVTKFSADGSSLIYSTYLGGSDNSPATAIAVDAQGHAYVTGFTFASDFPIKNAYQKTQKNLKGFANAFVTKFAIDGGSLIYSTYLGRNGKFGDSASGIAVDRHGNTYVTGSTSSSDFPIKDAFQKTLKGPLNAFVTKLDRDGDSLVYSSYLGGSGGPLGPSSNGDRAFGVAVDLRGDAYVTGSTESDDFPVENPFQKELRGSNTAFVTKIGTLRSGCKTLMEGWTREHCKDRQ